MSVISEALRQLVVARAGNRCEYCHIPAILHVGRFPIDHICPRTKQGETTGENLALACHHCNAHKWMHTDGFDADTNQTAPLFHPREQRWEDHFEWSSDSSGILLGKTQSGRATIARLQLNDPQMISVRSLLALLGLFPEITP